MDERSFPYNEELLQILNSLLQMDFWQGFVYIFADGPVFFMPLFLVGYWLYYTFRKGHLQEKYKEMVTGVVIDRKKELLNIFYTAVAGLVTNVLFQKLFNFERPEELCKSKGNLIIEHIPDASFPSDHAAMSFAFMVAVFLAGYKKIAAMLFFVFTLMNISRVMACVHWPYDVLVGSIFGSIIAIIVFKFLQKNTWANKLNEMIISLVSKIKL